MQIWSWRHLASGRRTLWPVVWRIKWPPDIVKRCEEGALTINDLEMAALLLRTMSTTGTAHNNGWHPHSSLVQQHIGSVMDSQNE